VLIYQCNRNIISSLEVCAVKNKLVQHDMVYEYHDSYSLCSPVTFPGSDRPAHCSAHVLHCVHHAEHYAGHVLQFNMLSHHSFHSFRLFVSVQVISCFAMLICVCASCYLHCASLTVSVLTTSHLRCTGPTLSIYWSFSEFKGWTCPCHLMESILAESP
jgi:hypothetical protein